MEKISQEPENHHLFNPVYRERIEKQGRKSEAVFYNSSNQACKEHNPQIECIYNSTEVYGSEKPLWASSDVQG